VGGAGGELARRGQALGAVEAAEARPLGADERRVLAGEGRLAGELGEEVGKAAEEWRELKRFYTTPGFAQEQVTVFLATGLTESPHEPDPEERIEVVPWPLSELDRAIERFAELYAHHQSVDELVDGMVDEGYSIDLVDEIEKVSTIAFGRAYFERAGIRYPETVVRARADGRIETVPTASLPAFSRARAIAGRLATTMPEDEFRALCLYNAESQVIVQYLGSTNEPELSKIKMYPSVVPDRGASDATIERALSNAMPPEKPQPPASFERPRRPRQKPKPWWKFW